MVKCRGCKAKSCGGCWIQGAVKRKGSLTKFAAQHGFITQRKTIDLPRAKSYVERNMSGQSKTMRLRQINLAKNLRNMRR